MKIDTALVLAAGKSTRFGVDKLLTKIYDKVLLEYIFDFCLKNNIKNINITLNKSKIYIEDNAIAHPLYIIANRYRSLFNSLNFEFQNEDEYGPAAAIKPYTDKIDKPFIVLFCDNFYDGILPEFNMEKHDCYVSYIEKLKDYKNLQLSVIKDDIVIEKPHSITSGRYFCGYVVFTPAVFTHIKNIEISNRNEYEITDLINNMQNTKFIENTLSWFGVTYCEDLEQLKNKINN